MDSALFDMDPAPPVPPVPLALQRIAAGAHPLAGVDPTIRLHPAADRTAAPGDPRNLPYRCGTCRHRAVIGYHNRAYPKCTARTENPTDARPRTTNPRISHSTATDVRAWWPACVDYTPGDPAMSPDAARSIPEAPDG